MKQFLRYTLTLVAILIATTNAWAQAPNLQYQWVTRFDNTITFDNADLQKITNGTYVKHVKFSITDVSYYHKNKLIGDDVDRLDYTTYRDNDEHQSTWSWAVETNDQNPYRVTVTDIKCQVRGKNSDKNEPAYAWFNSNSQVDCRTKDDDEGGSQEVGISNANGLGNSVIFKRKGYYKEYQRWTNIIEDYVTFTLHNIRYTCKVEQQVPLFQYKAIALTNNSEYGSAYSSWTSFANATNSESSHSAYNKDILSASNGLGQKVYFKAVPKAGYTFVGWKESANATTYLSYDEEYSFDFTSISNDLDAPSTIKRYAVFMGKQQPQLSGPATGATKVGNIDDLIFTFINTSNAPVEDDSKDFYFTIQHKPDNTTKEGSANPNLVISYDPINKKVTGLNSGTATITFVQKETSTHYTDTLRCTITVTKQATDFALNFAKEYYVDDEINKSTFLTNATNSEVAIQVSDKTADNRTLFTYKDSILKANGDTLNADSETTTITVTQPENYKWTSYTQEKNVTVKKRQTNFAWNDGESLECYVDDQTDITKLYTKASDNTLPVNFNIEVIERGYGNTDVVTLENGVLEAIGEGKVVVTASQAVHRKWTDFSTPITINVKRYDVSATLNPTTTVWNATHSNPFSVSISPANGETITDFIVGESSNSTVATYNASSKTIQTYYTSGSANFQITRREDRKYNALDQTLTLTVNANWGCNLLDSDETTSIDNALLSSDTYSKVISFEGIGDTLKFQYRVKENATVQHNVTPQYSTEMSGDNFTDFNTTYSTNSATWSQTVSVPLNNENIKRIRFKRTSSRGTKTVELRNINITRAQYIRPTDGERALSSTDTLKLPTVAIGQPSSKQFKLKWSACSDIKIVWNNSKFSINPTNITARDGSLDITVSCNTSDIGTFTDNVIIYNQEQMETFPISCEVYTKWITDSISGSRTHSMKVDESWGTDFYFPIQRASQYPTTDGPFHYAIERTFVDADPADRNPSHPDEVISYNNGVITAHNAGTAILTIKHDATDKHFASKQFTCTLTVSKHDAEFNWKDHVYYNDTIYNYFTTTDTISPIDIVSQTDTDVAKLTNKFNPTSNNSLDLITFNKEASTTVTVSQKENYKWNGYSEPHTITPIDPNNHVTFTITENNDNEVFVKNSYYAYQWKNGGIQVGDNGGGFNRDNPRYVIIEFTGIPDKLIFDYDPIYASILGIGFENTTTHPDGIFWFVQESDKSEGIFDSNGKNPFWDNKPFTWSTKNKNAGNTDSIQLSPDTRFIKLGYWGNFGTAFKNVTVTELNQFEAVPNVLDFGLQYVDNPKTTKSFDFKYANAGYKVHLQSTDTMFTVATTYIDTIGGEKYGTVHDIQVTYNPLHVHQTTGKDAMILIWDEAGHRDTVFLHVNTVKSKPSLYWTEDWSATEPIVLLGQHMPDTVAKATNGYPVKYRSDDESILKIADDSLSFIAVGIGETYITAHADSDRVYLQPDTIRKLFRVTDKLVQRIVWEDNLTDFCIGDGQDTLRAQVWVLTDAANGTWEYSPEQTAELKYSSPNENIATVSDSILTIHGLGEMFLNATVPADSTYEMASAQIPVRVRDCSVQCTDADLIIPILKADGSRINPGDLTTFNPYLRESEKIVAIDTTAGIPGHLIFAYDGRREWGTLAGKIRVFESTDGGYNWQQVLSDADAVTPLDQQAQYSPYIPLSRNATHIKFARFEQVMFGYHYLQYITITPAQYIESIPDDIDFGNVYLGNTVDSTIAITYSSLRSNLQITSSHPLLTTDKTTIEDECGAWDTIPLTISLKADISIMGNYNQYITVTDPIGGMTDTIHVYANIVKNSPTITWETTLDTIRSSAEWETQKTAFASSGDQVHYELTAGNQHAYLNDAGKMILLRGGRITARAYTEETTTSNEVSAYHNFYIIVDPLFEDFDNDSTWNNDNNWNIGRTPWATDSATIKANKHVQLTTEVTIDGIQFEAGSSIHITHTGGLTINEQGVTDTATDGSSIIIDNNPQGAGFLRISPSAPEANKHPYFTMNFTTRAFNEGVPRDETWQYMGAPGNQATIKNLDSQTLIYHWDETKGWTPYTVTGTIPTWQGYALTQSIQANHTYHITAQAMQGTKTIDLTYTASGMKGDNLFVNSFTAPIDITKIDSTTDVTGDWKYKTFYFFNTGSWNDWQGTNPNYLCDDASSAGHYYAVPLFSAQHLEGSQTIVPPMQGVYVHTDNADVSITLDYTRHVWNGAAGNLPMRAPQKQSPDFQRVRIQVSSENSGADRMYIIQVPSTTRDYDNGYDGKNINAKGQVNIYTNEPFGKMEVSCANNIDSMYIGLRTGSDTHYTLTFGAVAGDSLYLQDLENDSIIPIFDDEQYHFTAEPNAVNNNRFLLLSRPYKAPNGETSTPETDGDEPTKIWSVGKVIYIANAPANSVATLYTVSGHLVLSTPIANTQSPTILDVSYLPEGVYILRLNDQVYKFVCK